MGIEIFKKHLREKRAIKIGVGSSDLEKVGKICRAAQSARASAVDIPYSKEVYDVARKNTKLPIIVSSIHPFEILEAVKMGADGVQIGNYWDLYRSGKYFNAEEIYDVVLETMGLINDYETFICVTIPASIELNEQAELIHKLEVLGVDMIQTEGYKKVAVNSVIVESAFDSIVNLGECLKVTGLPIMTSSGMSTKTLFAAFERGASAVAVDNAVNQLPTEAAMKTVIMDMVASVSYRNSINREMVRTQREMAKIEY